MTDPHAEDALLVRPSSRAQRPALVFFGALLCLYLFGGATGVIGARLVVLGVVVFGVMLLIGGVAALKARRSQWELRLDGSGLTVRSHAPVPWADIAEVKVTGLRPRWLFWSSFGYRVVSFVGTPGVELPALPSTSWRGSLERRSGKWRERLYGSRLVVMPHAMDASTEDIIASVRRWSDVPVR